MIEMKYITIKRQYVCVCICLFIIIFISIPVSAINIESELLGKLETQEMTKSIIVLKNMGSKTLNKEIQSEIIYNLSKFDLQERYASTSGRWFSAWLTKESIEKLKNNHFISDVFIDREIYDGVTDSVPFINATVVWNNQIIVVNSRIWPN